MDLKELRKEKKMTQQQVADLVGICLRSYKSYENEERKKDTIKYEYIYNKLIEINKIDEEQNTGTIEIVLCTPKELPKVEIFEVNTFEEDELRRIKNRILWKFLFVG